MAGWEGGIRVPGIFRWPGARERSLLTERVCRSWERTGRNLSMTQQITKAHGSADDTSDRPGTHVRHCPLTGGILPEAWAQ